MNVSEKTMDAGWRMVHEETVYEQYEATVDALMDPALGPDRLVVAGPHEQDIRADQTRVLAEEIDEAMRRMRNPEHRQIVEAVRELIGRIPGGERT